MPRPSVWWQDKEHPIWAIAQMAVRLLFIALAYGGLLALTVNDFNADELREIAMALAVSAGAQAIKLK